MSRIIRLTESDLTRIVKRVINEGTENNGVKRLISLLVKNDLIDMDNETINVYDDHIEVYSIKGFDYPYFVENFIELYPEDIDEGVVYVKREDYGEEIDDKEYEEVLSHMWGDWYDKLGLEFLD